jgi:tetratricopeptide (TPR) repeat protein
MKKIIALLFTSLIATLPQAQSLDTKGGYSPTVVAKSFTATYGVRADAVQAILEVYARQGLTPQERKARAETLIGDYQNAVPHEKGVSHLSSADQQKLGIATESGLVRALNWDMFARQYYLSTAGANSPAIVAAGDVAIWYGIPEPALRTLAGRLEANAVELGEFGSQLKELAEKYEALKKEFEIYGPGDPVVRQAEKLLDEGKLEEAEALLETDYRVSKKRLAYKAHLYARTKELLMKYSEAEQGYRDAVALDSTNIEYLIELGDVEEVLANSTEAICTYEIGLRRVQLSTKPDLKLKATLLNNLGASWDSKAQYEKAIAYYEQALALDTFSYGYLHPDVAMIVHNIGAASLAMGEYEKAIFYFQEGLKILDSCQPQRDIDWPLHWGDLGAAFRQIGDYDKALYYLEKALERTLSEVGQGHPHLSGIYNAIGTIYSTRGDYDRAIKYHQQSLEIDSVVFGMTHPHIAAALSNIATILLARGENDSAIVLLERVLEIDTLSYGMVHPAVALAYSNLGASLCANGQYQRAILYLQTARDITRKVVGEQHASYALTLLNLGSIWNKLGKIDSAQVYFEAALAIDTTLEETNSPQVAREFGNLSAILHWKGDHLKAIEYAYRALAIDTQALGPIHPYVAADWSNLAASMTSIGNHREAISCLEKAIAIDTVFFGMMHPNVGVFLMNLATALEKAGDNERSIDYAKQSIPILKAFYPEGSGEIQNALRTLILSSHHRGKQLSQIRQYKQALGYFEQALNNASQMHDKIWEIKSLSEIGEVQKSLGNYVQAMESLDQGILKVDSIVTDLLAAESPRADSPKTNSEDQPQKDSLLHNPVFLKLRYQKIQCLVEIGNNKEAKKLTRELIHRSRDAKDEEMLLLVKNSGWR